MFIVFEGIEGSGKSTQVRLLKEYLESDGIEVVVTREPGGTPFAEEVRSLILNNDIDPITETLLLFAGRREHINNVIKPALDAGKWVICDRYVDSTYVYQEVYKGVSGELIVSLEENVLDELYPDYTFLLDLEPELAYERVKSRGNLDKFEKEGMDLLIKTREGYNKHVAFIVDVKKIDANQSVEDVHKDIVSWL